MPISSFPAAPVDSGIPPDPVTLPPAAPSEGLLGDPVMDGEVEFPDGMTTMLPEAVADALLPDAVADAEVGMLVAEEEQKSAKVINTVITFIIPTSFSSV
jgi:hypothetical protein